MTTNLPQAIEAILFATAEPQTYATLASRLNVGIDEIAEAISVLATNLEGHGITLLTLNEVASLATASEHSALIEAIRKDELSKDLSKASAETLAVIAYTPGTTKSQIEFIRGVNVSYSLRALQMRGLIEQKGAGRGVGYHPTLALLEHFGVTALTELPDYAATKAKIEKLLTGNEEKPEESQS
jgi:segregation and condensation protein B